MASSKDLQQVSRPVPPRPSPPTFNSLTGSSVPRQAHSRTNSHTTLSGTLLGANRVGGARRKSASNNAATMVAAAVAAGIADPSEKMPANPIDIGNGRASNKSGGPRPEPAAWGPAASLPVNKFLSMAEKAESSDSAVDDQENASPEDGDPSQKERTRRASDGQSLAKEGRKFNRPEIHCQHCGKGYKHSSCLTKHLWEHTPEWSLTSKLLISKHQQVQLLEAASVLVAMNNVPTSPPDSARETSPSVSGGFSEQMDGRSSANTTPPPQRDALQALDMHKFDFSPMSSDDDEDMRGGLSRSLHPLPSDSGYATSLYGYQESSPPLGPSSMSGEADHLAKAVAMLSCSYGSNAGSLTSQLPLDIPAVPAIPAQFLGQVSLGQSPFLNSFPAQAPESHLRGASRRDSDVRMEDGDDDDMRSRARSDEDDHGVFAMEE
ncbi:hypothetical protein M406DRAFT_343960 [Cryphonectria parasitica EP155]|uniref:C2H2-type domain-containing protein n=1 Tax=Cryphonectria parasitica (strain ATCC 38755 / EP155) TaxID=660469 RepID=A0A9P4YC90_CRYP1|nr:uncharacterized protein M406DRAFT_343960 [Cryphonectria parasitica EP155]KAF3770010.1 hypothetical protein M406DRAFT_343960 [Cryphonectria parasitica EP155]